MSGTFSLVGLKATVSADNESPCETVYSAASSPSQSHLRSSGDEDIPRFTPYVKITNELATVGWGSWTTVSKEERRGGGGISRKVKSYYYLQGSKQTKTPLLFVVVLRSTRDHLLQKNVFKSMH